VGGVRRPDLTSKQRMASAQISGLADRLTVGVDRDTPRDEAVAEVHAISADPVVLGVVLGGFLHRVDTESAEWQPAVELLRAAGADEDTAAAVRVWLSARHGRSGGFQL
jgi:hypothetical protein